MKRFISAILSLILLTSCCGWTSATPYSISYNGVNYTYNDTSTLIELIDEQNCAMAAAHEMANAARQLGYSEDHHVIALAKDEWVAAYYQKADYQEVHDALVDRWTQKEKEYPSATYIWNFLKTTDTA